MMSRLIDDMSLKDRVSEYTLSSDEYEWFCRIIDAEPTAYNVDNVLKQLEEEKELSYADFDEYVDKVCPCLDAENDDLYHRGLDRAIEIVKQGGES